ncbi:MAG TPA: 3-phosphoshikimate 1-carboxyvinyltransferase [Bacteroidales bacterium]|nr:3-phosphoshikimate 1-carboxyvinyltransferase [Bacteroidales bacterium]
MSTVRLRKQSSALTGSLQLPYSKSISNRLLIIRALSGLDFPIHHLSDAGDTILLTRLLEVIARNTGGHRMVELDTGNAGTAMRFLTALLSLTPGKWILTGSDRMKERPVGILVDALKPLGAHIEYLADLGYPPLMIKGNNLKGGEVIIDPGISSQFVSALLLIAPVIPGGLGLFLRGPAVSFPYVDMTIRLLHDFGVQVTRDKNRIQVTEGKIIPGEYTVETDWSSAAFWYEAVALSEEAELLLTGLRQDSLQGDSIVARLFRELGVNTEYLPDGVRLTKSGGTAENFTFNFSDYPDIAPAVIASCAFLGIHGRFEGLKNLKIKESDRLISLKNEFVKAGLSLEADISSEHIRMIEIPRQEVHPRPGIEFETYGDHRIAMTMAPLALRLGEITIREPEVVTKSYPGYWEDMKRVGFEVL